MNRKSAQITVVLFLLSCISTANAGLTIIGTNTVNVGKIYNYDVCTNKFVFVNTGKSDIKILNVFSTCPCLHGHTDKKVIKPAKKLTLTTCLDAQTVHGEFTRGVWMETDSPDQPRLLSRIEGEVLPLFSGIPGNPLILQAKDNTVTFTNEIHFVCLTTNFFLNPPSTNNPIVISSALEKTADMPGGYRLTLITKPPRQSRMTGYINLPVSGPAQVQDIKLYVKFITGAQLKASPAKLIIPALNKEIIRTVYLRSCSPEINPDGLTFLPQFKGLTVKNEAQVQQKNLGKKNLMSLKTRYSGYKCLITISPDALKKFKEMQKPAITFKHPKHGSVKLPLFFLN